jgi:hypothetical protein
VDAQRQLVLRTFANANGDAERAAKTLGMEAAEVRRELMALLNGSAGHNGSAAGIARDRVSGGGVPSAAELPSARAKPTRKK